MNKFLSVLTDHCVMPPPFWLMRQAGRYLPEYRELREKAGGFLNLCLNPELATEVTLQPLRRFDMDAAILFSDILIVPHMLGQDVTFTEGEGPKLGPLDVNALNPDIKKVEPIFETVRRVKSQLNEDKALIGFAGSPWSVACYMLKREGAGVNFREINPVAARDPAGFERLIDKIIDATLIYLEGQIEAGADVIQLFDSWAGSCDNVQRWVIEPTAAIVMILRSKYPKLPIIGFPRQLGVKYLNTYAVQTAITAISLDQGVDMAWAVEAISRKVVLQGNLDPELLRKGGVEMEQAIQNILSLTQKRPFIFNLGHGINKDTPVENVEALAQLLKQ